MHRLITGVIPLCAARYSCPTACIVPVRHIPQCTVTMPEALRHAKSRMFFPFIRSFSAAWHHMSSHDITRHTNHCFTTDYTRIILHHQEEGKNKTAVRRTTARRKRRAAIRRRWIFCPSGQSKLSFGQPEMIRASQNDLPSPDGSGGISSKVGNP